MRLTSFVRVGVAWLALAALYNGACSAAGGGGSTLESRAGAAGTAGQGGSSGASGNGSGGTGNVIIGGGTGNNAGSGPGGDACADQEYAGEQKPLDMYVMFDQSGSMNERAGSDTRWNVIKKALKDFVRSEGTEGLGVGIQYFPRDVVEPPCSTPSPTCFCIDLIIVKLCAPITGGTCSIPRYVQPDVAIAPLPGVAGAIETSLDAHRPGGGTPTSSALDGAIQHATQWAAAHTDRKTIVVLATDGEPEACDTNVNNIAAIAARGLSASPPVQTYVIGVGDSLGALNAIAAGGGGTALIINGSTANAGQQFLEAMNRIRGTALGCDFNVPGGAGSDLSTLNVTFTPTGSSAELIYKANSEGECSATLGGWFFPDSSNPSSIRLCPKSCDTVKARPGKVRLSMGCTPSVEIPE
ncbi:MAG TPA: vWA domain-containing protein [Polyangiaceae bacterium]|nr:vWA domain-containing protein [Polyangiaceae bacterium]